MKAILLPLLFLLLPLQAPATEQVAPGRIENPGNPPIVQPLMDTRWKLIQIGDHQVTMQENQTEPHLVFQARERRVGGSGGCNRLMGGYEIKGDEISFSKLASTMMACQHGMEGDQALSAALAKTRKWKVTGRQLELFDAEGRLLARFEEANQ